MSISSVNDRPNITVATAVVHLASVAIGAFDEGYRYGQDYDLWLRASLRFRSAFHDRSTCVTRTSRCAPLPRATPTSSTCRR